MQKRICRYILLFISSIVLTSLTAGAQSKKPQVSLTEDTVKLLVSKQVYFNVAGVLLCQMSEYGEVEGGVRVNLKNKFFPTVEVGLGLCDKTDDETDNHFKTSAPFVKIGCDYNFARQKASGNRIYGGLRVGYTPFKYDFDSPAMEDPYWAGQTIDIKYKNVSSHAVWAEVLFGLETKIYRGFRMGWTARYKRCLNVKGNEFGKPWYVPGYGKNKDHLFTGTFNVAWEF